MKLRSAARRIRVFGVWPYRLRYYVFLFLCPREESNLDHELRKLASYPLNDGGDISFL